MFPFLFSVGSFDMILVYNKVDSLTILELSTVLFKFFPKLYNLHC